MLNKIVAIILILLIVQIYPSNKRDFRGAWIATVKNIDWPSEPGLSVDLQKLELKQLFNSLHQAGINAVLFQVRTESDALYQSQLEPWSYWLTGEQAKPPQPLYDPLEYAIKLARQRGMEIHAWFNPFRVKADTAGYEPDSSHISFQRPQWIIQSEKYKFLNPGIPEAREYVKEVVLEVVKNYDIDGIHFDDYFYPYGGMIDKDVETFKNHSREFSNIEDWRRDNVNIFVRDMYNSIKQSKPYVKFGISPFGIWKNGVPEGISGFSSYHQIYCDAVYWVQEKIVDYIVPQLYWQIGGKQDYIKLANWWTEQTKNRHVYIGHALYKMEREKDPWIADDITDQIRFNHQNNQINGSIYFRAKDIQNNLKSIADSMQQKDYKTPALIPKMAWIDSIPSPLFPFNLRAIPSANGTFIIWDNPKLISIENEIKYNVVYRFIKDSTISISDDKNILAILPSSQSSFIDTTGIPGTEYKYIVSLLDRSHNESELSNITYAKFSQLEILDNIVIANELFEFDLKNSRIKFSIIENEIVNLTLFNQNGDKIFNLLNEELEPGNYGLKLNLNKLQPNKYFYKITTPTFSDMQSFINSQHTNILRNNLH